MISRTLGAPLGGTTEGGQYGFESFASCLMTPPNFGGGGGICFPSIVVVALGDPGAGAGCADAFGRARPQSKVAATVNETNFDTRFMLPISKSDSIPRRSQGEALISRFVVEVMNVQA